MMGRRRKRDKSLPQRVYRRGPSYYYVHRSGKWENIGKTLPDAYRRLAAILNSGTNEPEPGTISAYLFRYADEVMPLKAESTQANQRPQIETLREVYGHMRPGEVMKKDIARFLDRYESPVGANRIISLFSHFYTKLIRWGVVEDNPCVGVERNKERPEGQYVSDETFAAWLDHAPKPLALLSEILYMTGLRPGDALGIKLSDITPDGLRVKAGKTGKTGIYPLSGGLGRVLDEMRLQRRTAPVEPIGAVLMPSRTGDAYDVRSVSRKWRAVMDTFEGQRFVMRDLRAKHASDLDAEGGDATRNLQHSSRAVTARHYLNRAPMLVALGRLRQTE